MKIHRLYALPLLLMMLCACQTLGLEKPTEFPDRVAYAYSNVDGVVKAATNSLNAHAISSDDAKHVRSAATNARNFIVAAETAYGIGDMAAAEGRLALAEALLRELQARVAKGLKP